MNPSNRVCEEPYASDKKEYLIIFFIFLVAFIPRFLHLGHAIIADEQLWILRSKEFARALMSLNFSETHISNHPGVITMWLGAISIGIANILLGYNEMAQLLFAAQLPFALATSAIIALFYIFSKKAFNRQIAMIATTIFAFDPFYLAFSRIIHLDAMLTGLMALSFLAILIFYQDPDKKIWLLLSAAFGGLSIIAKVPGVFMIPMTALVSLIYLLVAGKSSGRRFNDLLMSHIAYFTAWCLLAVLTAFIVWPAMWSHPMDLVGLFAKGPGMVAHEQGQFFLGKPVDDPGSFFYLLVIIFRTTPLSLVFLILGTIGLIVRSVSRNQKIELFEINIWLSLLFITFFIIMVSIADKKAGRYVLPVFPVIALVSAAGIFYAANWVKRNPGLKALSKNDLLVIMPVLVIFQLYTIFTVYPYFLSYYNPIAGGPKTAEKAILIGRGEGMDLVAEYLNRKPGAESLTIASEFSYLLHTHFKGHVLTTKASDFQPDTLEKCDYLVVYISGLQKRELRIPKEVLTYYETHSPEKTITINGIAYARIFDLKKHRTSQLKS